MYYSSREKLTAALLIASFIFSVVELANSPFSVLNITVPALSLISLIYFTEGERFISAAASAIGTVAGFFFLDSTFPYPVGFIIGGAIVTLILTSGNSGQYEHKGYDCPYEYDDEEENESTGIASLDSLLLQTSACSGFEYEVCETYRHRDFRCFARVPFLRLPIPWVYYELTDTELIRGSLLGKSRCKIDNIYFTSGDFYMFATGVSKVRFYVPHVPYEEISMWRNVPKSLVLLMLESA